MGFCAIHDEVINMEKWFEMEEEVLTKYVYDHNDIICIDICNTANLMKRGEDTQSNGTTAKIYTTCGRYRQV